MVPPIMTNGLVYLCNSAYGVLLTQLVQTHTGSHVKLHTLKLVLIYLSTYSQSCARLL